MLAELFEYRFASSLGFPVTRELHLLTGMLIGDTSSPYKDTPGSGRVAGTANLTLERGEERDEWYLSAFTHDLPGADLPALALLYAQLRILLTSLTRDAVALFVAPALPSVQLPQDRTQLLQLGDAQARTGGFYQEAVAYYTCALAVDTPTSVVVLKRAVCLRRLNQIDDALIDYTSAIALEPQSATPYAMRASVYTDLGRQLNALSDLAQAQLFEPGNAANWSKTGLLYYDRQMYAAAAEAFSTALALGPNEADLYYFRGCAVAALDHMDEAARDFAEASERYSSLKHIQLADVLVNRIAVLVRISSPDALKQAAGVALRLLQLDVLNPPPATLYLLLGDISQRLGDHARAVAYCDQALALVPADPRLYNVKGTSQAELGQLSDALGTLNPAVLLETDTPLYLHNRAITLGRMGRHAAALEDYSRALLLDPRNALLHSERGQTYAVLGQDSLARADYLRALALEPDDLPTMLRFGALLGNQGDVSLAKTYLTPVLEHGSTGMKEIARQVLLGLSAEVAHGPMNGTTVTPPTYEMVETPVVPQSPLLARELAAQAA